MEISLFEQAGELVRALSPAELGRGGDDANGEVRFRAHRRGVKIWFGPEKPTRFHYEAQIIPHHLAAHDAAPDEVVLEVGFHAEHGDERRNTEVIDDLKRREKSWRRSLGAEAQAAPFLGNANWGRLSETWSEPDLDDPDLAFELASRLVDYIQVVQPLLDERGS